MLLNIVKDHRITVINPHFPGYWVVNFIFLRLLSRAQSLLISIHGADLLAIEQVGGLSRYLWRWMMGHADKIIACSQGLANQAIALFPKSKVNITYIHNGIAPTFYDQCKSKSHKFPVELSNNRYILSVGTFERKKGFDLLIEVFASVQLVCPEMNLVLVGRTGPELVKCRSQAKDLGLSDVVLFYEGVDPEDIAAFYKNAELFVSASRYEPFGLVMLEAGIVGVPVVATRTMGACEIIENEVDGILVPVDDKDALFKNIRKLMADQTKGERLARALREKVLSSFSLDAAAKAYQSISAE